MKLVMNNLPEYTLSLLIWILPICAIAVFFMKTRLLSPEKIAALAITISLLAGVGCLLDLFFAHVFFIFPDRRMICGVMIMNIPVEEFIFYITGFWFVLFVYVYCDEYWLARYNVPDDRYVRFRARLQRMLFLNCRGALWGGGLIVAGCIVKMLVNPEGMRVPGYFIFLVVLAYTPMILFHRVTRKFVNWPAFTVSLLLTLLISVIWEVTLALPRGYWGYREGAMLGLFIGVWHNLPIEAVTVWAFCPLVILVYEFLKIRFFTPVPKFPGHRLLLMIGRERQKRK
jgi:hypothetical protein